MLRVNLKDDNFAHHHHPKGQSISYKYHPSYFQWERGNNIVSDSLFITDRYIPEVKHFNAKRKVAMLVEPLIVSPSIYSYVDQNHKDFDFILTHEKSLIDSGRNFLFYPAGCGWVLNDSPPIKTKLCSMIASNKMLTKGHVFRSEVIKVFANRLDHFGLGYRHIESKEEGLRDYCFSIVMENGSSDYYFSEKLIDSLLTRTIPIYWGSRLDSYFDMDGILAFNTIDELEQIFVSLSFEMYQSKIRAVENNFLKAQQFKVPEDWLFKTYPFLFT